MRAKGRKNYNRLQRQLQQQWKQQQKKEKLVNQVKAEQQFKEEVEKIMVKENFDELDNLAQDLEEWIEQSTRLQKLQQKNRAIYNKLNEQLSIKDQEISDIRHVIELGNFNASQGYKLAKDMQEALQERRRIKTQLDAVDMLNSADFSKVQSTRDKLRDDVEKLQRPMKYNFRQRKDLEGFLSLKTHSRAEILGGKYNE